MFQVAFTADERVENIRLIPSAATEARLAVVFGDEQDCLDTSTRRVNYSIPRLLAKLDEYEYSGRFSIREHEAPDLDNPGGTRSDMSQFNSGRNMTTGA